MKPTTSRFDIRRVPRPEDVALLDTQALRNTFLVESLFEPGRLNVVFTDLDRMVVGGASPLDAPLPLGTCGEAGRRFFLERRELGAINIGGPGRITMGIAAFELQRLDAAYVPAGSQSVVFETLDPKDPAKFYLLGCPAHETHPAACVKASEITPLALGSPATANSRKLYKVIHDGGIRSQQLVMGFTVLGEGSVWNTFPPHVHNRRSEIYLYFDLRERVLAHFLGEPRGTRHLFVRNEQAVLSPPWSIHAGCGFGNYAFVWGMAGENKAFDDMDPVDPLDLR